MSAQTKHTPGAWIIRQGKLNPIIENAQGHQICIVNGVFANEEANAKLIAAAPDMAEALKGVLRVADRKTVEFDAARAALAKAGIE